MKTRKISSAEITRVAGYCEFVTLSAIAALINIKLATVLLLASPAIILIIVGIKEKNFHFFQNEEECKDISA